ncbi:DUF551 domain-containing protein [Klebsiella variicola]|nr:DUF551 domain-containing protein [Klebsiella variicola]PXL96660.1 DUF551 domain-containing protein [Klebsiella variicola]HBV9688985.1 DUF551 domain-containing protein [Klebsiella variicola]
MKFEEWLAQQDDVIEVECGCVTTEAFYHWMRVAYEAGNSPVVPDDVSIFEAAIEECKTCDSIDEHAWNHGVLVVMAKYESCRAAILAAAPQSPGSDPATVPGKWIPVSERMPEDDDFVYIWPRPDFGVELHVGQYCERSHKGGGWYAQVYEQNYGIEWHPITVTHWMPLPAGPQEVR